MWGSVGGVGAFGLGSGVVGVLVLDGGEHPDGGVRPSGVVPVDPLGGGDLDIVDARPGALVAGELGLVQRIQGLRQSVVVGVTFGAHRGHRLAASQGLSVADGAVLHSAVAMMDEAGQIGSVPAAPPDAHVEGIKGEVGVQAGGGLPAHDPTRVHIRDNATCTHPENVRT